MIFLLLFFIVSIQAGLLPSVTQSEHKARVLDTVGDQKRPIASLLSNVRSFSP